jgi:acetoin utilization protein AcuB
MFVRNKMTSQPFTISPDQTIVEAQALIDKNKVKRLPVVKNGRLVGIVAESDIERASPSKATALSMGEAIYILSKTKISSIMTKNPVTIHSGALLEEAALLMRDKDIGCLPVVDDEKLVGIITASDILDSFIELLGFHEPGTRLTIEAKDAPGILSILTSVIASFGANITHVAVYRGSAGKSDVVVGTNALDTTEMEAQLEQQGFRILHRLKH